MNTIFLSAYQKPEIGTGQIVFALSFLIAFIFIIRWTFKKDSKVNNTYFGNAGMLALIIGGALLLIIIVKIILRQMQY